MDNKKEYSLQEVSEGSVRSSLASCCLHSQRQGKEPVQLC